MSAYLLKEKASIISVSVLSAWRILRSQMEEGNDVEENCIIGSFVISTSYLMLLRLIKEVKMCWACNTYEGHEKCYSG
jgi:hypothetical protein